MNPDPTRRRSIRLPGYDYTQPGGYFVTVAAHQRQCLFGAIVGQEMVLNDAGRIIQEEWERSALIRQEIELDEYVIMPNHFHCIVFIREMKTCGTNAVGANGRSPLRPMGPAPRSLGSLMAGFKSITTKRVNLLQGTPGMPLWQRNYYEHILRDNDDLDNVRRYILDNPLQWALDAENTGQSNKNDNDSGRNSTYDIATPYFPEKMKGR